MPTKEELIRKMEEEIAVNVAATRPLLENNLFKFNRHVLQVEKGKGNVEMAQVHRDMCEFIDKNKRRKKLLLIPRSHLKSTIVTVGRTLQAICTNPETRVLIANANYKLACGFLTDIKRHLKQNDKLKMFWGDLTVDAPMWNNDSIKLAASKKKEPTVTAKGVESDVTSQHYDIIILDDLVNDKFVNTQDQIQKTIDFYKETLNLLEPNGEVIIIGCFTGDTKVLMGDTSWKQIKDVQPGDEVISHSGGSVVKNRVKAMIPQGRDVIYEVKTKRHSVRANERHPFLMRDGTWKRLRDLQVGDSVVTIARVNNETSKRHYDGRFLRKDFFFFLGYMFGDGWVIKSQKRYHGFAFAKSVYPKKDKTILQAITKWFGVQGKLTKGGYYRFESAQAARWLEELGLVGGAKGKVVPDWMFSMRGCYKKAFVDGLLSADGSRVRGDGYRLELASKNLIEGVYWLSLTCGYRPGKVLERKRIIQPPNSPKPVESTFYSVSLVYNTRQATGLNQYNWRWERIQSIEEVGEEEVYDLSVENDENFIANGYVVHNTRWHDSDLYGWIMDKDNAVFEDFDFFVKRAYGGDLFGDEEINLLFPQKHSKAHLRKLYKQLGPYFFSSQYLNEVIPSKDADFKQEWFQYYDPSELKGKLLNKFTMIDPAISVEKDADFTAIVTVGVDEFNMIYVLDIVRKHMKPKEIIDEIFKTYELYRPIKIGIEDIAFQKSLQYSLHEEMNARRVYLPLQPLKPAGRNKDQRIRGLQPLYANAKILHNKTMLNNANLEDELLRFPRGKHDDVIDALAYGLDIPIFAPKRKVSRSRSHKYLYA